LRVDQGLRHAVAGEIVEADILKRMAQLGRGLRGGAGFAGQEVGHIDQRNLAADHFGR